MRKAMFTAAASSPPIAFRHTSIVDEICDTHCSTSARRAASKSWDGKVRHADNTSGQAVPAAALPPSS